jgi:serine/threonine protein kinase
MQEGKCKSSIQSTNRIRINNRRRELPTVHPKILERISDEAKVISNLDHPNIIKMLGYSEKVPLLIYEYADYGTLYWLLSKGWKPSQKDILLIGIQLGDTLRYLHSRGLIHGDIKPGNILIKNRISKLGDFSSITKLLTSTSHSGIHGVAPGTIGFRAPEQVYSDIMKRAKKEDLENRIDVYQLANLIRYMWTEELLDEEEAIDGKYVEKILSKIPDEELREILAKALDSEPSKRPSAEELAKALYKIYTKTTKT